MEKVALGTLDHVHIVVPDREAAAQWYEQTLGFRRVSAFSRWAELEGGPLHLSADGDRSGIALFQAWNRQEIPTIGMGVGFRLDAEPFTRFMDALPALRLPTATGGILGVEDIVDFDLCFSFGFLDPYGNQLELNCYEHARIQAVLRQRGIAPVRHW